MNITGCSQFTLLVRLWHKEYCPYIQLNRNTPVIRMKHTSTNVLLPFVRISSVWGPEEVNDYSLTDMISVIGHVSKAPSTNVKVTETLDTGQEARTPHGTWPPGCDCHRSSSHPGVCGHVEEQKGPRGLPATGDKFHPAGTSSRGPRSGSWRRRKPGHTSYSVSAYCWSEKTAPFCKLHTRDVDGQE